MQKLGARLVLVVNGHPRSGKDTAVSYLRDSFMARGYETTEYSTIDPVRQLLRGVLNPMAKGGPERDLLAEVGNSVEKYNSFRTRCTLNKIQEAFTSSPLERDAVIFLHLREPAMINKLSGLLHQLNPRWQMHTIFVDRPGVEKVTSNTADAHVEDFDYNMEIKNHGDLADLQSACDAMTAGFLDLATA